MQMLVCLVLACLASFVSGSVVAKTVDVEGYIGTQQCKTCHVQAYNDWQGSHHDWAMKEANAQTVLGDFSDVTFDHYGEKTRLFKQGENYFVETDNAEGKRQRFKIAYTFGFYPLQQYLIPFEDGRYQALNVTWDSRPKEEGGQRWFHLYPNEPVPFDDQLHWTGPYHNWNSRCADCHSTQLQRNYKAADNTYDTSWFEINVGCEACHGPGQAHLDWLQSDRKAPHHGFAQNISAVGEWLREPNAATATQQNLSKDQQTFQIDTCGSCHARRSLIDDMNLPGDFHNKHNLQWINSPLYHADGQILDEVYVLGSFMQSKMFHSGVVCSNCHNPHSLELKAPGNGVCLQCHNPEVFDTKNHHHHPADSAGAQCANCHMPETTYMVVDPRRDHSLRIPRPDLSEKTGAPNACNQCHTDRDNQWAAGAMTSWLKQQNKTLPKHRGEWVAEYQQGSQAAAQQLLLLAMNPQQPALVRASTLVSLQPTQEVILAAQTNLYAGDPLVRRAAVQVLGQLPDAQRLVDLLPLATDGSKSVRMEVASQLQGVDNASLSAQQKQALVRLQKEYLALLQTHADTPSGQLNIGVAHMSKGELQKAEAAYRQALILDPNNILARLNLADLYRSQQRDAEGEVLLRDAIELVPESAAAHHSLGLLLIRTKRMSEAVESLQKAASLDASNMRYGYIYVLGLKELGQLQKAQAELSQLIKRFPNQADLLGIQLQLAHQQKQWAVALRAAEQLLQLRPQDRQLQQMIGYYRSRL
ncbi:tetratricopeptide repeat protein [Maricurvus nonylphenolicus]|uniref:tetratricopeptide repeat protein n=1 Tax=Maricurvus nonylphenolicus TaxID=1008307 RepID=UPI0036F3BBB3